MGIKNEQFVNKVADFYTCQWICMQVLEDPKQCRNGHVFCKECITRCLEAKQTCPVCKIPLTVNNLVKCLVLKEIIENFEVYCHPQQSNGHSNRQTEDAEESDLKCDWTGKLQSLAKHRETCPFQQVQCPNVNCNTNMQRRQLENHDKICEYKELECDEQCGVTLIRRDLLNHKRNDCPEVTLPCPNGCEASIKRKNITRHRETCPFQQVQCPNVNCNTNMQRRELEDHDKICEYKLIECKKCQEVMLRFQLKHHKTFRCPEEMVPCPNNCTYEATGQMNNIKRINLDDHLRNECAKTILDCPFKDQGCSVQVERQHVDKHVQDNMATHMMLLANQYSTLTKKCESLTEQVMVLTKENKQLKEEFYQVKNINLSRTYGWRISNCLKIDLRSSITSPIFRSCGFSWYLKIIPYVDELVSVHLFLDENNLGVLVHCKSISVQCRVTVRSHRSDTGDLILENHHVFWLSSGFRHWSKMTTEIGVIYVNTIPAYCDNNGDLTINCSIQVIDIEN